MIIVVAEFAGECRSVQTFVQPCEVHKTTRDAHLSKANLTNLAKCSQTC